MAPYHADTGENTQNVVSSSVQHLISFDFCNPCFFHLYSHATASILPTRLHLYQWCRVLLTKLTCRNLAQQVIPRILDILILQDKTLFCACVDNFKQKGGFWRHCACADNFKQNGVFLRQHLPVVRVWTWPKYNKHHHDLKNQLCRFIDMYIGKIFWPTAPCRGCPEKEIWRQG